MTNMQQVQHDLYEKKCTKMDGNTAEAKELAAGILFLLKEYYIGSQNGDRISVRLENGQNFSVSVEEDTYEKENKDYR